MQSTVQKQRLRCVKNIIALLASPLRRLVVLVLMASLATSVTQTHIVSAMALPSAPMVFGAASIKIVFREFVNVDPVSQRRRDVLMTALGSETADSEAIMVRESAIAVQRILIAKLSVSANLDRMVRIVA